jgi:hypothetical protein
MHLKKYMNEENFDQVIKRAVFSKNEVFSNYSDMHCRLLNLLWVRNIKKNPGTKKICFFSVGSQVQLFALTDYTNKSSAFSGKFSKLFFFQPLEKSLWTQIVSN